MSTDETDVLLYAMQDAARVLGVGRTTMYGIAERGEVEIVHIGRRALVTRASLVAYVAGLPRSLSVEEGDQR